MEGLPVLQGHDDSCDLHNIQVSYRYISFENAGRIGKFLTVKGYDISFESREEYMMYDEHMDMFTFGKKSSEKKEVSGTFFLELLAKSEHKTVRDSKKTIKYESKGKS